MRKAFVVVMIIFGMTNAANAQHSDIEFGYNNSMTGVEIEGDEVTSEGFQFFEAEFNDNVIAGNFQTDDPGFLTSSAENLLFESGDRVFLTALDASEHSSFGTGFLNFFNPADSSLTAAGSIEIAGAIDTGTVSGTSSSGNLSQLIDVADGDGDVHSHVDFDLLNDDSVAGTYGILFQVDVDQDNNGSIDVSSDKFWILFNHKMDEEDFESLAVPAFGGPSAVPEPSGLLALSAAGLFGFVFRRRRR